MPLFPHRNNPTIDKYFRFALNDLIDEGKRSQSHRPIARLGHNLFVANHTAVLIRYANEKELAHLERHRYKRCFYLLDDDLGNLEDDDYLPLDYKFRLKRFSETALKRIIPLATDIVAPNERILDQFADQQKHHLNPCHPGFSSDLSHFDRPTLTKILYSGTRSHYQDLELVSEVLLQVARANPQAQITTFLGRYAPKALLNIPNIDNRRQAKWRDYQRVMATERYHLAIAPLIEGNFNRARSVNKIADHAAFGAAGLYSSFDPIKSEISDGVEGFLIAPGQSGWLEKISTLLNDPQRAKAMASEGIALARRIANPLTNRSFWINQLDIADAMEGQPANGRSETPTQLPVL